MNVNWQMVAFAFLTGVTLYSAFRVVTTPNVTHAALYLAVAFVGIAGYYLLLGAEFLAAVQVLVYAGAVMTVMVFAIMLSGMSDIRGQRLSLFKQLTSPYWGIFPFLIAAALVGTILAAYSRSPLPAGDGRTASLADLGKALLSTYLVPFEVASVLLLAAMVGAIILSRREGEN